MKKWLFSHKFLLIFMFTNLLLLPITYEDYRADASSNYECCVLCFMFFIGACMIGYLFDKVLYKECEK